MLPFVLISLLLLLSTTASSAPPQSQLSLIAAHLAQLHQQSAVVPEHVLMAEEALATLDIDVVHNVVGINCEPMQWSMLENYFAGTATVVCISSTDNLDEITEFDVAIDFSETPTFESAEVFQRLIRKMTKSGVYVMATNDEVAPAVVGSLNTVEDSTRFVLVYRPPMLTTLAIGLAKNAVIDAWMHQGEASSNDDVAGGGAAAGAVDEVDIMEDAELQQDLQPEQPEQQEPPPPPLPPPPPRTRPILLTTTATIGLSFTSEEEKAELMASDVKYLSYNWRFGEFNNQRRYLYAASAFARVLNRTLCIPPARAKNDETQEWMWNWFGDYLDLDLFATAVPVTKCVPEDFDPADVHDVMPYPYIDVLSELVPPWHTNETALKEYGHIPNKLLHLGWMVDAWDFGGLQKSGLSLHWNQTNAPLFGIPRKLLSDRLFWHRVYNVKTFEAIETEEFKWYRSRIAGHPVFTEMALETLNQWHREGFGVDNNFIALHLREHTPSHLCPVCCGSYDPMYHVNRTLAMSAKIGGTMDLLYAIDPHTPHNYSAVFTAAGYRVKIFEPLYMDSIMQNYYEQAVHRRAKGFIGALCSTYSFAIYEDRVLVDGGDPDLTQWW